MIKGNVYAGFDRHNSEVLTYYLAMVLNYKWIAPSVIRRIDLYKDILPHATAGLNQTMIKNGEAIYCCKVHCSHNYAYDSVILSHRQEKNI